MPQRWHQFQPADVNLLPSWHIYFHFWFSFFKLIITFIFLLSIAFSSGRARECVQNRECLRNQRASAIESRCDTHVICQCCCCLWDQFTRTTPHDTAMFGLAQLQLMSKQLQKLRRPAGEEGKEIQNMKSARNVERISVQESFFWERHPTGNVFESVFCLIARLFFWNSPKWDVNPFMTSHGNCVCLWCMRCMVC